MQHHTTLIVRGEGVWLLRHCYHSGNILLPFHGIMVFTSMSIEKKNCPGRACHRLNTVELSFTPSVPRFYLRRAVSGLQKESLAVNMKTTVLGPCASISWRKSLGMKLSQFPHWSPRIQRLKQSAHIQFQHTLLALLYESYEFMELEM